MVFFGIGSYEPEKNVKLKKTCCFYSNPMYFTCRNRSELLSKTADTCYKISECFKRLKLAKKVEFYFEILTNYYPAELFP